jgi:hypothetical protein
MAGLHELRGEDSNLRPPGYERDAVITRNTMIVLELAANPWS